MKKDVSGLRQEPNICRNALPYEYQFRRSGIVLMHKGLMPLLRNLKENADV